MGYGDQYRQCLIEDYTEIMYWPNRQKENNTPDDAEIYLIGDSYFERSIAGEFICTELENLYGYNIYDISGVNSGSANNPIAAVEQLKFSKDKQRILVLETTERFSLDRGLELYTAVSNLTGFRNMPVFFRNDEIKNWLYKIFLNRIFYIEHNYITLPVLSFKNTLNFKLFKVMDNNIGAFSTEPPLLFYSQDVEFARRNKTREAIDSMVNNIVLGESGVAFAPLLMAHGAVLACLMANKIFYTGAKFTDFKLEIIGWVVFLLLIMLGPLHAYTPWLRRARRTGLREYGMLASRYAWEFDRKWVRGGAPAEEQFIGSADIQSLADLGNSFQVIADVKSFPYGRNAVTQLVVSTLTPVSPLVLTMIPLEELIDRVIGTIF